MQLDVDGSSAARRRLRAALVPALVVLAGAVAPGAASAATVGGTTHDRDGTRFGTMRYRSGHGVANRVTITPVTPYGRFRIVERAERLRASGECEQVDRHTAECPWTESEFAIEVVVGSRADRVDVHGKVSAQVRGGGGDDVLAGDGDELFGDRGADLLLGGSGWDRLHGGPGRDRIEGRGGSRFLDDVFYDDETDAQAARDVVVGGSRAAARIDYSMRARALRIDLRRGFSGPERDSLRGVAGVVGGAGDDVLVGDDRANALTGGAGDDRLDGRGGGDVLDGGLDDDVLEGGAGDDRLTGGSATGDAGADRFRGGPGADTAEALDAASAPDDIRCDAIDAAVASDAADRLHGCATVAGWDIGELELRVQPQLTGDRATFTLRCGVTEMEQVEDPQTGSVFLKRCRGGIALRGAGGEDLGSAAFRFDMPDYRTPFVEVAVPLTDAGRHAVRQGAVIAVEARAESANGWTMPAAGYRAFMRAGITPAGSGSG